MQALTPAVNSGTKSTVIAKGDRKALMTLGNDKVAVRIGRDGFITRVARTVRLYLGTDLYIAKDTGANSKVSPYQPGYMKLVAGAGGILGCPPTTRDPVSGEIVANPQVEYYPNTGTIRRVTATAVCVVRNPATGAPIPSRATIMMDCEHVLSQSLMKLASRADAVRYMSAKRWARVEDTEEMESWAFLDLGPIGIAYNLMSAPVSEAVQTFKNLAATARQRTMSKAERLACDHNAGTRMTWEKGMLTPHPEGGPSFVDVPVIAWVEERDAAAMEAFMADVASSLNADVESVFANDDGEDEEVDDDIDPADAAAARTQAYRALPDHGEPRPVIEPTPAKEKVEARPVVEEKPKAKAGDSGGPMAEIAALEAKVAPAEIVGALRAEAGIKVLAEATPAQLTAYLAALKVEVSG